RQPRHHLAQRRQRHTPRRFARARRARRGDRGEAQDGARGDGSAPGGAGRVSERPWLLPAGWQWRTFAEVVTPTLELADAKRFPSAVHIAPNHIESGTGRLIESGTIAGDKVLGPKHK